ncbi:hypothetical protein [Curtobacterium sp. MCBD17_028]|uniref:hypothetical protein n=1 Tax=Curtobacterium sp. MCBD17_028 TaxID=2175670 RepID=UPI0015E8C0C4|nr:hypothetical protein [Curtobacterium sp. MCBD17_028]
MSKISISGQVPAEQNNGLIDHEAELLGERTPEPLVAIVIIDRHGLKFVDDKQDWSATVKFRHIEPLSGAAADTARALLESAYQTRTGEAKLDFGDVDGAAAEDGDPFGDDE